MNITNDNYFTLYSSRTEAWEQCQDLTWMFVMIDESGYSSSSKAQKTLRQYACQLARDYWHLILHPDLRMVVETTEKFIFGKVTPGKVLEAGNIAKKARVNSTKEGTPIEDAAHLAEYCAYPRPGIAAALAAKYALKLGANETAQIEMLRELVGNPYSLDIERTFPQYWWQCKPTPKTPWKFLVDKINVWLNPEAQQKFEFHNFLGEYSSITSAWNYCQNPEWMLAMLDLYSNYCDTQAGQIKLRQFACCCAREEEFFYSEKLDERIREAVQIAEQFTTGLATYRDLKSAEITVSIACEDIKGFRSFIISDIALFCTHQSAMVAALGASGYLKLGKTSYPVRAQTLRELIGNPFDF